MLPGAKNPLVSPDVHSEKVIDNDLERLLSQYGMSPSPTGRAAESRLVTALNQAESSFMATTSPEARKGAKDTSIQRINLRPADFMPGKKATAEDAEGDIILRGMQKLRKPFEEQFMGILATQKDNVTDPSVLVGMQYNLAKFTLMIDLTSKFVGKVPASVDTLLRS